MSGTGEVDRDASTDDSTHQDVVLTSPPALGPLYARALLPRRRGWPALSERAVVLESATDARTVAVYARTCGFGVTDALPVTYPHVLAFAAQMHLMVTQPLPFPLLGLVHVRQRITAAAPIAVGEPLRVRVWASDLAAHPKGVTVDLHAEVSAGGEPVWSGLSRYLRRGADATGLPVAPGSGELPTPDGPAVGTWPLGGDTGRRYARVSGDVNPIHLSALTARPLGFERPIAHGMFTMARTLAALGPRALAPVSADVAFGAPVLLPATLALVLGEPGDGADGVDVAVRSGSMKRVHLSGSVRPL